MKYPVSLRLIHWTMAVIILGLVALGLTMVSLDDKVPVKFDVLYPWHKSFGVLILLLATARLGIRLSKGVPGLPDGLAAWEKALAKRAHVALYALMLAVPVMGYCMSSSYTQSDGVFFFGYMVPELLPKNDDRFEVFRFLHRWLAYGLLAMVALHAIGALKHRFFDRDKSNDVLARML